MALRVPTPDVSVVDLVAELETDTTEEAVNEAFRQAASGSLAGILDLCDEPLVSVDFTGNPHSSIVDGPSTKIIDGGLVKVLAWYDNEMGLLAAGGGPDTLHWRAAGVVGWPRRRSKTVAPETLADEVVVVRVDYNLPLDKDGEVVDDTRLVRTLPTIQYLVEAGAKAVLLSHHGAARGPAGSNPLPPPRCRKARGIPRVSRRFLLRDDRPPRTRGGSKDEEWRGSPPRKHPLLPRGHPK